MELEERHTWCGDEWGKPRVYFGFPRNPSSNTLYL
jgi:hypothetical protein